MSADQYTPPEESPLGSGEWLAAEKQRLARLGLESGQRLVFHFPGDPSESWVENLGRFERPICKPNASMEAPNA